MSGFQVMEINRHRMRTDGKGVTALVALAGCPLSCPYCINAELLKDQRRIVEMSPGEFAERLAYRAGE